MNIQPFNMPGGPPPSMLPPNAFPVSGPSASASTNGPSLQRFKPLVQSAIHAASHPSLPYYHHSPLITIGATVFDPEAQRFIIHAMCFYDYTAEQVARCLGMLEDGSLEKSAQEVEAAKQVSVMRGLMVDGKECQQNDATYRQRIKARIQQATEEQMKRRSAAREKSYVSFDRYFPFLYPFYSSTVK